MLRPIYSMNRRILQKLSRIKIEHIASSLLIVGMFALTLDYVRLHQEFSQFKKTHAESVALVQQVKSINVSLAKMDKLLSSMNKFSSKLKMIAQIPQKVTGTLVASRSLIPLPQQPQSLAPEFKSFEGIEYTELKEQIDLDEIEFKVDDLLSEALKQTQSFKELHAYYEQNNTLLASVPSIRPTRARVTSNFGYRRNPNGRWQMHEGMDFAAFYGTKIVAPADGLVEKIGYSPSYGRYLILDHGYGLKSKFAHTSKILVKPGQYVKRGRRIALVGRTGSARGTHLHYEVKVNGVPVDPRDYMFN